jgi:hypothetical protein
MEIDGDDNQYLDANVFDRPILTSGRDEGQDGLMVVSSKEEGA